MKIFLIFVIVTVHGIVWVKPKKRAENSRNLESLKNLIQKNNINFN